MPNGPSFYLSWKRGGVPRIRESRKGKKTSAEVGTRSIWLVGLTEVSSLVPATESARGNGAKCLCPLNKAYVTK